MDSFLQAYLDKHAAVADSALAPVGVSSSRTAPMGLARTNTMTPAVTAAPRTGTVPSRGLNSAHRFAAGAGAVSNAIGAYQSLTNKDTSNGYTVSDPSYTGAAFQGGLAAYDANRALQKVVPHSGASTIPGKAGKVLGAVGKWIGPAAGALDTMQRWDNDRTGAYISAAGTAAPYVGQAIGAATPVPGGAAVGRAIGEGVNWGTMGINGVRDMINGREQPIKIEQGAGPTFGSNTHSAPAAPQHIQPLPNNQGQPNQKVAFLNNNMSNTSNHSKAFARGFVKAAVDKNVSLTDFSALVKKAFSAGERLTYDDLNAIKQEISDDEISPYIYDDPSGEAMRAYKAKLLKARDAASGEIPAVAASLAAARSAGLGGAVGAGLGAGLGAVGKHSGLLNIPYKYRKSMPTAGAVGGAAIGAALSAVPAAKQKYDAIKALQKLHSSDNLESLQHLGANDRALLNQ